MINPYQGAPSSSEAIEKNIRNAFDHIHTAMPGSIITYEAGKQRAQIKLGLKRQIGSDYIEYPPCINVPIAFPGSQGWSLFHEVKQGDEGLVIFSQKASDLWKQQGGTQEPFDCRTFSQTDAVFFPGVRPDPQVFPSFPSAGIGLTDKGNDVQVRLESGKAFIHKGGTSLELTDASAKLSRGAVSTLITDAQISSTIGSTSILATAESITLTAGGQIFVIGPMGITHNGINVGATHVHAQKPDFGGDKQNDTEVPH